MSGSGISWVTCKSALRSRQITTLAPHHSVFTGRMPFLPPNQQRQSTEGNSPVITYKSLPRNGSNIKTQQYNDKYKQNESNDQVYHISFPSRFSLSVYSRFRPCCDGFATVSGGEARVLLLDAEHSLCTAPWSGTPCRTTSAHSRTTSPLDRA